MKKLFLASLLISSLTLIACNSTEPKTDDATKSSTDAPADKSNAPVTKVNPAPSNLTPAPIMIDQTAAPKAGDKIAVIETNFGTIKFKLFPEGAPETVKNFETLANDGKYNGSIFHRVIEDFMIQGGDFENGNGTGGYSYQGEGTTIAEEFNPNLKHLRYAVSMAKTSAPHSTGSQFFIVHNKNGVASLDGGYSVFGQVYEGQEVVDKIANMPTDSTNPELLPPDKKDKAMISGGSDRPIEDVIMKKVTVTTYK